MMEIMEDLPRMRPLSPDSAVTPDPKRPKNSYIDEVSTARVQ